MNGKIKQFIDEYKKQSAELPVEFKVLINNFILVLTVVDLDIVNNLQIKNKNLLMYLNKIANQDYRGNRCTCSQIAQDAIGNNA